MSLKAEFDKEIYKTAMISLLFDYYKKYKEYGLNIPDSVHSYTKTYYANESIKGWIEENLEECEKGHIELKIISTLYAEVTDKKLTVKQLREELVGLGYIVKNGDFGLVMKNWIQKTRQDTPTTPPSTDSTVTPTEDRNENIDNEMEVELIEE